MGARGRDLAIDDLRVPEPRVVEQRVVGVQQRLVAAAVQAQRGTRAGVAAASR